MFHCIMNMLLMNVIQLCSSGDGLNQWKTEPRGSLYREREPFPGRRDRSDRGGCLPSWACTFPLSNPLSCRRSHRRSAKTRLYPITVDACIGCTRSCIGWSRRCIDWSRSCIGCSRSCIGWSRSCIGCSRSCIGCSRSCIGWSRSCIGWSRSCIGYSRHLQFQSRRTTRLSTIAGVTWI